MEDSKINYNIHNHYPQTSEGVYRKACDSLHERNTLKLTSENDLTNVFIFPGGLSVLLSYDSESESISLGMGARDTDWKERERYDDLFRDLDTILKGNS